MRKFLYSAVLLMTALRCQAQLPAAFTKETVYLWEKGSRNDQPTKESDRPLMDVYYPKNATTPHAAILICPGGGYGALAKDHEGKQLAEFFASHGIASAVVLYRVSPHRFPAPYADACRAMRLLRQNATKYHLDPARLGMMGFSAGGHLASTVTTQPDLYRDPDDNLAATVSARPDRAVLCYAVISMDDASAHQGSVKNLLGENPDPAQARQMSSYRHVTASTPPTFLWHTADDAGVPVQNSLLFAQACAEKKVPVALHIFPKGRHGVGMAPDDPTLRVWPQLLLTWLGDWPTEAK
ncbi:MAG: alpha/beta hydrolase [Ferruginibacter sp.]|nr:alpha/beta hydrolase [Cytophagales bacterium]